MENSRLRPYSVRVYDDYVAIVWDVAKKCTSDNFNCATGDSCEIHSQKVIDKPLHESEIDSGEKER
ncbi:MAG: hypothetical protein SFT93_03025 [Rickettsiaceae bacterium]|nr:hypothetical protein [Rickettsiaceae bacterium]